MTLRTVMILCMLLLPAGAATSARAQISFEAARWREDVRVLAREIPARHPDAFYRMSRARWDSATTATERRMPSLTRDQAIVALMQLVALVHDGHTAINPFFTPVPGLRYYPLEFYAFEDGLFIRSSSPDDANLAGARVIRIGRVSVEEALRAAATIVSHENEWWVKAWAPVWLGIPELLDGLGLVDDMEHLPLVVERAGRRDTVVIRPAGTLKPPTGHHRASDIIARDGWTDMREPGTTPLWLRHRDRLYWMAYQANDRTLYVCYRGVADMVRPPSVTEFWSQVFALVDSLPVTRFVLDVRENTGGNSFYNRQVVRGLIAHPALDRPDRLFVIIGRRTFSAAMNLARDLRKWTNATFVGEPTGNAMYFFGDHEQLRLPASGLAVNVSSLPWPPYDARERGAFLPPQVYAPMTSAEYRRNVDPAMRAILERGAGPGVIERVRTAVGAGDTVTASRWIEAARTDVANRFRSPEGDVNRLGYRLLHEGRVREALAVFRLNARSFPSSANAWDSLGEALISAGERAAAIAAYTRALEIDPRFPASRNALARLGVAPP